MSLVTFATSHDEINSLLWAQWQALSPPYAKNTANPVPMYWQGLELPSSPPGDTPYANTWITHTNSRQGSLSDDHGQRKWTRSGIVTVQVFTPLSDNASVSKGNALAQIARDAFEGKASPGGVWFRNATITEVGPKDGGFYQINMIVQFTYDEVK